MTHVIIVGGGASGVLTAVHLLRRDAQVQVTLIEKSAELGAGAAYSTNHPDHLLNVRASNMSAFPDQPDHFVQWLRRHPGAAGRDLSDPTCFAPRHLYRDYLAAQLTPHIEQGSFRRLRGEVVALAERPDGIEARLQDGAIVAGDAAVVATGNEGPELPPEPWRFDGWSSVRLGAIAPDAAVVVVGTGLTMVDRVMMLLHAGHRGPITAVSRRGVQPQAHRVVRGIGLAAEAVPFGTSTVRLVAWMRQQARALEATGGDWRGVVDGLRPHTQALWQHLPVGEKRRFLRHARPFWDSHRHRVAPDSARRLDAARADGQFTTLAAHVTGFVPEPGGVEVHLAMRGSRRPEVIRAGAVFECRGRSTDVTGTQNPVLRDLLVSGTARPDALALGLDVTLDDALIGADGVPSARLFGVGPVTSGVHWEVVAVPDIRNQAARLAAHLSSVARQQAETVPA